MHVGVTPSNGPSALKMSHPHSQRSLMHHVPEMGDLRHNVAVWNRIPVVSRQYCVPLSWLGMVTSLPESRVPSPSLLLLLLLLLAPP